MMKILGLFHSCVTGHGYPIALVALVAEDGFDAMQKNLPKLAQCKASANHDIYGIDIELAKTAKAVSSKAVLAIGLNINVARGGLSTGGVIGDPNARCESSENSLEELGNDLWCYSRAGGPGFVLHCTKAVAGEFSQLFEADFSFQNFQSLTRRFQTDTYIYVEDGTCNSATVAVSAQNIEKVYRLGDG